jgi:hypothetical protein
MSCKIANLVTAALAVKAPITEVFAVVGQQPVLIFTHPRERSLDDFFSFETDLLGTLDPERLPGRKPLQCQNFYRPCVQARAKPGVVNDFVLAQVDPMMVIAVS